VDQQVAGRIGDTLESHLAYRLPGAASTGEQAQALAGPG
jgi:hypothetical protein